MDDWDSGREFKPSYEWWNPTLFVIGGGAAVMSCWITGEG
jgi:hypothetical protein